MQKLVTLFATWTVLFMLSLWTPADAATVHPTQAAKSAVTTTTDISARRYYRRYYRPYYYGGYYGPRPYYGYGYGYYRPYRPYYYAAPFPFFGFPFF